MDNKKIKKQADNQYNDKVKKAIEETSKREIQQAEQLQQYLKEIKTSPKITPEEEGKLWKRKKIIETGSDEILEKKIFNAYRELTVSIVNKFIKEEEPKFKRFLTRLELILFAEKILSRIIKNYAWHQDKIKINFSQYATNIIRLLLMRTYSNISKILWKGESLKKFFQRKCKKEVNKEIRIMVWGMRKGIRVFEEFSGNWEDFEKYVQTIPEKDKWEVLEEETVITDTEKMLPSYWEH